jgi:hypothetical protein
MNDDIRPDPLKGKVAIFPNVDNIPFRPQDFGKSLGFYARPSGNN